MSEDVNKQIGDNEDAFEREAAEGFAMLGSEEEIASLKAETDLAFANQLDNKTKPAPRNWVWAAAAVLVLGLGISVFTVLQPEAQKDVAIVQPTQAASEPAPAPLEAPSSIQESSAAEKEQRQEKPSYTPEFKTYANQSNDKTEPEAGLVMNSSSFTLSEPAAPVVAANSYKNADADDREELAAATKQEKNLRLEESSAEADVVQKERKKAKATVAPAPAKAVSAFETPRFMADSVGANGVNLVIYPAGVKQLRKDAKALLKGLRLGYPLEIELELHDNGLVKNAKVLSKVVMAQTDIEAAQSQLKKLPAFVVQKPADSTKPTVYYFILP